MAADFFKINFTLRQPATVALLEVFTNMAGWKMDTFKMYSEY